jgi:hypothetical protein
VTDKELYAIAVDRGFKSPPQKAGFRDGYTVACNGKPREYSGRGGGMKAAWEAGYDYRAEELKAAEPDRIATERTVEVDGKQFPVMLLPTAEGVDVLVPIAGETVTIHGATEDEALAAARTHIDRSIDRGYTEREWEFDVAVGGATFEIKQREFKSGAFEMIVGMYPQITVSGGEDDDQDKARTRIEELLAEHLGVVAEARTVDGERAKVVVDHGEQRLIESDGTRTSDDWLAILAERQARVDAAEKALKPYKAALKQAELELSLVVRHAAEAGALIREPSLPLGVD